ncbi:MAG TPA: universal stress protein [Solirubrobacterales bacterium]|nr:universal stress protein [Solirubrobacterales bacterium]
MGSDDRGWEPRKVLVGYDGSDGSKDAVALARVLCAGTRASVLLVNVLPAGTLPVAYRLLGYEEAPAWRGFFRGAEEELGGIEADHRTYIGGSPAEVLNDLAETEDVDLVVVGSPHRGAVGRAVLGSVAEALLHGASVAVVAAPRGYSARPHDGFARILAGYDGGGEAGEALRRAAALAGHTGRELHVLTVATLPSAVPGAFGGTIPASLPDATEVVTKGVELLGADVETRGEALHGDPAHELAAWCNPDDLLVVGSRSYGPLARTLLGSVSSTLIRTAPARSWSSPVLATTAASAPPPRPSPSRLAGRRVLVARRGGES